MLRWAVIDVETTGFGKKDHVIEVAIVLVDNEEVVGSWETLINPFRDISNTEVHGISPTELSLAPLFQEVSNDIAKMLNDRIIVAHNLSFDQRMLEQEFERVKFNYHFGQGFCTYQATKQKLSEACESFGISNPKEHSAFSDAMATAVLLSKLKIPNREFIASEFEFDQKLISGRTLSRSAYRRPENRTPSRIRLILRNTEISTIDGSLMSYLDAVTSALADLDIDKMEKNALHDWSKYLGLSDDELKFAHKMYLDEVIKAALRDGIITSDEFAVIKKIANLLEIPIPVGIEPVEKLEYVIPKGSRICFTGKSFKEDGTEFTRIELQELAIKNGFDSVDSVTKKGCDVLVAADTSSMSNKTKRARAIGIPVISTQEFLEQMKK